MGSPTTRSLAHLRKKGYTVAIVEKYNMYARIRIDLFGMFDLIAIREGTPGVLGIQTTTTSNLNARVKKIRGNPIFGTWLSAGNWVEVHGWSKKGARGKRKLWELKCIEL